MKELIFIYHFETSQNQNDEFKPACYKILFVLNQEGLIDDKTLLDIMSSHFDNYSLDQSFSSLDELKSFSLRLAFHFEKYEVRLISVQDYNIGIDGAKDRHSFLQIFARFGDVFADETRPKKKGLFGNLF